MGSKPAVKLFFVASALLLLGCANEPLTQADLLSKQVRAEKHMRACKNSGGIWYGTIRGGRCDWTPMLRIE